MNSCGIEKGAVVFSFDFELGWGSVENGLWQRRQKEGVFRQMRSFVPMLVEDLARYNVPVTWAIVGGLLHDRSQYQLDHLPLGIKDKLYMALMSAEPDTFFGRDLVSIIASSKVKHDFACHTYSHVRFNYPGANAKFVNHDLDLFEDLAPNYIELSRSFVFPQNIEGFHKEVSRHGYKVFRQSELELMPNNRVHYFLQNIFGSPPASVVSKRNDLTCVNGSLFFNTGYNKKYKLPILKARIDRGLRNVLKNNGVLHVWCHPFNFVESEGVYKLFIYFLEQLAYLRNSGQIDIGMMSDVVECRD